MKANELRIGSWVFLKSKNKVYEITSGYEIDNGCESDDFDPIPLSDEWLLKFDFNKSNKYANVYTYGFIKINTDQSNYLTLFDFEYGSIEFVHELQNFVFGIGYGEIMIK